jgi:hypothetical protein
MNRILGKGRLEFDGRPLGRLGAGMGKPGERGIAGTSGAPSSSTPNRYWKKLPNN